MTTRMAQKVKKQHIAHHTPKKWHTHTAHTFQNAFRTHMHLCNPPFDIFSNAANWEYKPEQPKQLGNIWYIFTACMNNFVEV